MINYGKQSISEEDFKAIKRFLRVDWLTQGPFVEKFENDLSLILNHLQHV